MDCFINLEVKNPQNSVYKGIVLRKFFNMIFIDPTGKNLSIYTATVFGGAIEQKEGDRELPSIKYGEKKDLDCRLDFKYSLEGLNCKGPIKFTDLTDKYWNQKECIEKVWGESSVIEDGIEADKKLKGLYPDLYKEGSEEVVMEIPSVCPPIFFDNKNKSTHRFMAVRGDYDAHPDENFYSLSVPEKYRIDGIEVMNWILTELTLSKSILDSKVSFSVNLKEGTTYYTPDFTWYFAPPEGYIVQNEDALIDIGEKKDQRNLVIGAPDYTTVLFNEWVQKGIGNRKKSRIFIKDKINLLTELSGQRLVVHLMMECPDRKANRQFLLGLLVAFFLAYCSDKTRLDGFIGYVNGSGISESDGSIVSNAVGFLFPMLILLAFLSSRLVTKESKVDSVGYKLARIAGIIGIGLIILLALYIFGAWMIFPHFMSEWITYDCNIEILKWCGIIAGGLNSGCILYFWLFQKRHFLNLL